MKRNKIALAVMFLSCSVYAESYLPNYGYYENGNEIAAKDRLIPGTSKIFDFDNAPNPNGETIENGRYYIPIQYKGGYNGTDTDYLYIDELAGKDGKDGRDGSDANTRVTEEKLATETQTRVENERRINARLQATDNRVDALDNRIASLEETKVLVDLEVRLLDRKHTAISVYNSYNYRHQRNHAIGLTFLFKIGKSYEETRIKELEDKLDFLMRATHQKTLSFAVQTATEEK